jgi:lipoprotein-anchoring transpeptidase ErfK/SrfK
MFDTKTLRMSRYALLAPCLGLLVGLSPVAEAGVVAKISLSSQRMTVIVDGKPRYSWPVSTAKPGYRTPTGTFKPQSLAVWHRSTIYSGSPMPHSIFFKRGYAIHGSYETKHLGRPASHGCIRLHPSAAAQLFSLVRKHGTGNTVITITN